MKPLFIRTTGVLLCLLMLLSLLPTAAAADTAVPTDPSQNGDAVSVTLPDYPSEWYNFRGSADNNGTTAARLPREESESARQWALALKAVDDWATAVSEPILAGDCVYVAVGDELLCVDKHGSVTARGTLAAAIDFTCRPLYLGGRVIVPLSGGALQALAADTLESVWLTEAPAAYEADGSTLTHQSLTTVIADGDYLYYGTACADWTASYYGVFRCVDAATGALVWEHENAGAGFYWGGGVVKNGVLFVADDGGALLALDPRTGEVRETLTLGASSRATVVAAQDSILAVTTDGVLHQIPVGADGALGERRSVSFAASSTGTPAIADGLAVVGGALGEADGYQGVICAIDLESMQVVQRISAPADVKSAPLVSLAEDGAIYAYFTCNTTPGGVYTFLLGAGDGAAVPVFQPEGEEANYCMASIIASDAGEMFYTNDSGHLFSLALKSLPATPEEPSIPSTGAEIFLLPALLLPAAAGALLCCRRSRKSR